MLPEVIGASVLTSAELVSVALAAKLWILVSVNVAAPLVDESVVVVDMLVIWPGVVILEGVIVDAVVVGTVAIRSITVALCLVEVEGAFVFVASFRSVTFRVVV